MVATCLLAERKNLRDLAAEYILLAIQRGETLTYLAEAIGTLLAHKYAPYRPALWSSSTSLPATPK